MLLVTFSPGFVNDLPLFIKYLLMEFEVMTSPKTSGQSYKASTIVIYDTRVVPDLKITHITTLES